jgi:hypothetical protein
MARLRRSLVLPTDRPDSAGRRRLEGHDRPWRTHGTSIHLDGLLEALEGEHPKTRLPMRSRWPLPPDYRAIFILMAGGSRR